MSRIQLLAQATIHNPLRTLAHLGKIALPAGLGYILVSAIVFNISHGLFNLFLDLGLLGFMTLGMLLGVIQFTMEAISGIKSYLRPVADQYEGHWMPYESEEAFAKSRQFDYAGQPRLF